MPAFLRGVIAAIAFVCMAPSAIAAETIRDQVRAYRAAHEKQILEEFTALLSLPNVATSVADIETNAAHIRVALDQRGFSTRTLWAAPDTPPAVFGELKSPGATKTVVFYAHYDGQPAAQPAWTSDPFKPIVRAGADPSGPAIDWRAAARLDPEWRVFGRATSDDKAPIQALLSALDALKAAGREPVGQCEGLLRGRGGAGLPSPRPHPGGAQGACSAGDVFVLSDGPRHQSGRMQVFFGARGVTGLELTVYGPNRPLHSGHYGNWAPNPGVTLTHLLAQMRDEDGRILIPGFYDDVRALSARRARGAGRPARRGDGAQARPRHRPHRRRRAAGGLDRPARR